uniref:Putative secreted protein n=1 Tax=Amblyomma americanum TaxID=6943 RepID=A0A0C9RY16_AMBAM
MGCLQALWACLLVAMSPHVGNGNTIENNGNSTNITEAVNTNQTLWLLWQTYRNGFDVCDGDICFKVNETCIRNMKINITKEEYYFNQTMKVGEGDDTTNYKGNFNDAQIPPKSMEVNEVTADKDYGQHQVWTLQYLQPDTGRCMVFSIGQLDSNIGTVLGTCDMYIKRTHYDSDPPESCKEFFMRRCNSTKIYTPYAAACIKHRNSPAPTEGNNHLES